MCSLPISLLAAFNANTPAQPDYQYYPSTWRDPYLSRRRENGWSLYNLLGIQKGDKAQSKLQHARNFSFFGAPAVIYISIDADMGPGSWLDARSEEHTSELQSLMRHSYAV